MRHKEDDLMIACVRYTRLQYPEIPNKLFFHVPNEGRRSIYYAKSRGIISGVSDLILLLPRDCYAGAVFELKTEENPKPSDAQIEFINQCVSVGYSASLCIGFDSYVEAIGWYMNL